MSHSFKKGDRVRRKKEYYDVWWSNEFPKILTVEGLHSFSVQYLQFQEIDSVAIFCAYKFELVDTPKKKSKFGEFLLKHDL